MSIGVTTPDSAFFGIYQGGENDRDIRRLAVVLTQSAELLPKAARETAELTAHGFIEGFIGAKPTLSNGRAVGLALDSINAWLFSTKATASLAALIFSNRRIGLVSAGLVAIVRYRNEQVVRLMPHADRGFSAPIGADQNLVVLYGEEPAEPGDRYVITTKTTPEAGSYEAARCDDSPGDVLAIVEIGAIPEIGRDDIATDFAKLPMRPIPQEGDTWDGFLIGRTLYRGNYTLIKRAWDTIENRDVLLKLPLPAMLQDSVFRAGFIREAWIGATVRSRWIASYIDLPLERRSSLYLVRPYYRGETLEQRLVKPPRISLAEGIGIALKLCAAVGDLDRLQIIHADLKPQNVLLMDQGGLKLLDLGLARLPGVENPDDAPAGGTTRYMAPELFNGVPAGPKSEVFSLGVTVYRMFSGGSFPFGQWEATPLARHRPDLPQWLGHCLARALNTDHRQRFQNAEAFEKALEAGLASGGWGAPRRRFTYNPLRLWQGIAIILAALCAALLLQR